MQCHEIENNKRMHGRNKDLWIKGVHVVGAKPGSLGDYVRLKLKQHVKLVYTFYRFPVED